MWPHATVAWLALWGALACAAVARAEGAAPGADAAPLRFATDGTFKLLQFTDLHLGEAEALDRQCLQMVAAVSKIEQPGLIVLSGDIISGAHWDGTAGWAERVWRRLEAALSDLGLPYAAILGNHDAQADLPRADLIKLMAAPPLSRTRRGPDNVTGAGNFWIDVLPSAAPPAGGAAPAAAARVWMLDSMARACEGKRGWGCVGRDTLAFVRSAAASLPPAPGVAFIHIPPPDFMHVWDDAPTRGAKGEAVSCPSRDTGAVAALRAAGAAALFCGHDHDNDYFGVLDGFTLGYGRKSGFGSYGPPPGVLRGGRVLVLREGAAAAPAETWLRLEDGSRQDQASSDKRGGGGGRRGARQRRCSRGGDWSEFVRDALSGGPPLLCLAAGVGYGFWQWRAARRLRYQSLATGDEPRGAAGGAARGARPPRRRGSGSVLPAGAP
ncbi:MAG: Metallo-dependent phosphatase-like protein [Monoraphidium minutum]|nr:MAG: Metallo-dependent phosphatase-like protein [Monoraphidium minutum]